MNYLIDPMALSASSTCKKKNLCGPNIILLYGIINPPVQPSPSDK